MPLLSEGTKASEQVVQSGTREEGRGGRGDISRVVGELLRLSVSAATADQVGVPDLAVEVVSDSDRRRWSEKLADYHELGVKELVRFDPGEPPGARLRVWDRVDEDLVERAIARDETPCVTLGVNWAVRPVEDEPVGLRLIDGEGRLLEVPEEAAERARDAEAQGRAAAEARVCELEEELRRVRGGESSD
jgi:hypothetical protein